MFTQFLFAYGLVTGIGMNLSPVRIELCCLTIGHFPSLNYKSDAVYKIRLSNCLKRPFRDPSHRRITGDYVLMFPATLLTTFSYFNFDFFLCLNFFKKKT